jgi:hypothetical protein
MSGDPIRLAGGINLYDYVENSPASSTDPRGLCPCDEIAVPVKPRNANLQDNIRAAENSKWLVWSADRLNWFYEKVKNQGPWDYKQQGFEYQGFGNFNYGATGAAAGIQLEVLLRGAGWAQERAHTRKKEWGHWYLGSPYGDDPEDQEWIKAGYYYYKYGCYK